MRQRVQNNYEQEGTCVHVSVQLDEWTRSKMECTRNETDRAKDQLVSVSAF